MCIRDRDKTDKTKETKVNIAYIKDLVVEVPAQIQKGVTMEPVSYTHLDVYKRQTIDGIKAGGKSVEKMEQLITEEIDSYVLNLVEREEGQESLSLIHIRCV